MSDEDRFKKRMEQWKSRAGADRLVVREGADDVVEDLGFTANPTVGALEGARHLHSVHYDEPNGHWGYVLLLVKMQDGRYAMHIEEISYSRYLSPTNAVMREPHVRSSFWHAQPLPQQERKEFVGLKLKELLEAEPSINRTPFEQKVIKAFDTWKQQWGMHALQSISDENAEDTEVSFQDTVLDLGFHAEDPHLRVGWTWLADGQATNALDRTYYFLFGRHAQGHAFFVNSQYPIATRGDYEPRHFNSVWWRPRQHQNESINETVHHTNTPGEATLCKQIEEWVQRNLTLHINRSPFDPMLDIWHEVTQAWDFIRPYHTLGVFGTPASQYSRLLLDSDPIRVIYGDTITMSLYWFSHPQAQRYSLVGVVRNDEGRIRTNSYYYVSSRIGLIP